jgi:uncharacterized protein with GYD domain
MSWYLLQATYSPATWVYRVTQDPEDTKKPPDLAPVMQAAGVKLHGLWYSLGEYDLTIVAEVPSTIDAATVFIGMKAGWEGKAFEAFKVTPLLTPDEATSATIAAAKALAKSRNSMKEGPSQKSMDSWRNVDFNQEAKLAEGSEERS